MEDKLSDAVIETKLLGISIDELKEILLLLYKEDE